MFDNGYLQLPRIILLNQLHIFSHKVLLRSKDFPDSAVLRVGLRLALRCTFSWYPTLFLSLLFLLASETKLVINVSKPYVFTPILTLENAVPLSILVFRYLDK